MVSCFIHFNMFFLMFMTLNEVWEVSNNVVTAIEMDWIFLTFRVTTPDNHFWFCFLSIFKCFLCVYDIE